MQTLVHIGPLYPSAYDVRLIAELCAICPTQSRSRSTFSVRGVPEGSPVLEKLLERLRAAGLVPHRRDATFDPQKHFPMTLWRRYDELDLSTCELLQVGDQGRTENQYVLSHGRDPLGYIRIDVKSLPAPKELVLGFCGSGHLVPDRIRRAIEDAGFVHVAFKPLVVVRDAPTTNLPTLPWDERKHGERWWELTADVWMPPLAPSVDLRHKDGTPLNEKERQARKLQDGVHIVEGLYSWPELRYRRADLVRFMPQEWDAAQLLEWGSGLVISRRFWKFLAEQGAEAKWVPVRIEE